MDADLEQTVDSAIQADLVMTEECNSVLNKDQGQTMVDAADIRVDTNNSQDCNHLGKCRYVFFGGRMF